MNRLLIFIFIALVACKAVEPTNTNKLDSQLMQVGELSVSAEEFIYAYEKNSPRHDSAFTISDIEDYLDLYTKFKLKIAEARSRGMDTVQAFISEFEGYREQLKKPYLTEKSVTEQLVQEAYDRFKQEVRASHILVNIENNDTLSAYNRALDIKDQLNNGGSFSKLAKENSDDPSVKVNNGDLGYFTSFQMVYPFESAAYNTPVGEVSMPIRTQFGYHLVYVKDKRVANGKVQVAHIMLRHQADSSAIKHKIFDIYEQASRGVDWDELVNQYSEDINSKRTKGILRPFGVAQMPFEFQEAAFELEETGQISDPVKTKYGWHILKLIKKEPMETYEQLRPSIEARIARDARSARSEKVLVDRLIRENGYQLSESGWIKLLDSADSTINNGEWTPAVLSAIGDETLMSIGDRKYTINEFVNYVNNSSAKITMNPRAQLNSRLTEFKNKKVLEYEGDHLEEKYIDYRMLVREYFEGILLFELMEDEVWNKAVEDSVGLEKFYSGHQDNYIWEERYIVSVYSSEDRSVIDGVKLLIEKNDSIALRKESLYGKYNAGVVNRLEVQSGTFEEEAMELLSEIPHEKGLYEKSYAGKHHLIWIKEVLPRTGKKLNEAKGEVISDYQDYLEQIWLSELRNKYEVKVNEDVKERVYEELASRK